MRFICNIEKNEWHILVQVYNGEVLSHLSHQVSYLPFWLDHDIKENWHLTFLCHVSLHGTGEALLYSVTFSEVFNLGLMHLQRICDRIQVFVTFNGKEINPLFLLNFNRKSAFSIIKSNKPQYS